MTTMPKPEFINSKRAIRETFMTAIHVYYFHFIDSLRFVFNFDFAII